MRTFIIALFAVWLTFIPAFGQEDQKPFDQMTIEELRAVDTSDLSKTDKKLHKKLLKSAEKEEKKRIKVEKRAEKKRQQAEAKRLKKEAKARKKRNKAVNKQLDMVTDVYLETEIVQDDFEAFIEIVAPYHPGLFLGGRMPDDTHFRGFYYPSTDELLLRLVSSKQHMIEEITSENIQSIKGGAERYITKLGYWHNYRRATLRGGIELTVEPLARYNVDCHLVYCKFREDIGITLALDHLIPSLERLEILQIKVSNRKGKSHVISLPPGLIIGYLKKLDDAGALPEDMRTIVDASEEALVNRLEVGP